MVSRDTRLPWAMLSLFEYTFRTRAWPTWARYAATLAIVVATLLVRLALQAHTPGSPFLLFMLAVILCAALFDHGCGILSVLLSAVLAKWFLIEPTGTFAMPSMEDLFGLSFFVAIGLITATILEALHRVASDLTDANERLVASEADKDLLLREASHRYKNELSIITALLHLQERTVQDESARAALAATAERIRVLGRAHERLQRSEARAVVDTSEFIASLCDDLRAALIGLRPITLVVEAESHMMPQERAVPIGLIINELLTNALKYAFPDERSGTVKVRFRREQDAFCLMVQDDGVGMSFERTPSGSGLGQRLVRSMVAQLQGTHEIKPDQGAPGTVVTVRFPA
jgi:two-component system, sensor histidine kinase PdtaS